MSISADVYLWKTKIASVYLPTQGAAVFEYDHDFVNSGIEVSPIRMPLSEGVYSFPDLLSGSFHGLPGLLADSLPDKFGNAVIAGWLASQGRSEDSFNAIDRLCYTGSRGMGALEYVPSAGPETDPEEHIDITKMVEFASRILKEREAARITASEEITYKQLLQLGTSAGGARAKAVIAWNETTNDIRSGQVNSGKGYSHWLIKFDGVYNNGDHGTSDGPQYTLIEYAYYLMATAAGITMNECRILPENGKSHFMTKRFDRTDDGGKIHMQTLGAIAHIDYNTPCLCSYEQASLYARRMGLTLAEIEQIYRRMVFNVLAVNHDDHVKNMSFLMDRDGTWTLSPAYDVTFAYKMGNTWLTAHQMTVNNKNLGITEKDLHDAGINMDISPRRCNRILEEVRSVVGRWPEFAEKVGINEENMEIIKSLLDKQARLDEKL